MKIPIFNSIYSEKKKYLKKKSFNLKIMNNLCLNKVDLKKFPLVKLLEKLPQNSSLYETILVTINDKLVYKFLDNEISFEELIRQIEKFSNLNEFQKYKKIKPKNIREIYTLMDYVSLKIDSISI
jgi:1-deoxy-D-xylulose-5-phosphate reductoisomerase